MQCACACDQQAALERERQATAWLGDKLRGERQVRAQMLRASWNPSPNPNSNPNPNPNPNPDQVHAEMLRASAARDAAPAPAAAPSAAREGASHRLSRQRLAPGFRSRALGRHDTAGRAPSATCHVDAEGAVVGSPARGRWRAAATRVVRPPSPSGDFSLD